MTPVAPTHDDLEDVLLSCRYGELDEVKGFVAAFGAEPLATVRDENGNTVLHMTCGNGHLELLDYLLTIVPPTLLSVPNNAKSTPLHWATTNKHMAVVQQVVKAGGPGLIDQKNLAGLTPVGEAEMVEWDDGANWLVGQMSLDTEMATKDTEGDEEIPAEDVDGQVDASSDPQSKAAGAAGSSTA